MSDDQLGRPNTYSYDIPRALSLLQAEPVSDKNVKLLEQMANKLRRSEIREFQCGDRAESDAIAELFKAFITAVMKFDLVRPRLMGILALLSVVSEAGFGRGAVSAIDGVITTWQQAFHSSLIPSLTAVITTFKLMLAAPVFQLQPASSAGHAQVVGVVLTNLKALSVPHAIVREVCACDEPFMRTLLQMVQQSKNDVATILQLLTLYARALYDVNVRLSRPDPRRWDSIQLHVLLPIIANPYSAATRDIVVDFANVFFLMLNLDNYVAPQLVSSIPQLLVRLRSELDSTEVTSSRPVPWFLLLNALLSDLSCRAELLKDQTFVGQCTSVLNTVRQDTVANTRVLALATQSLGLITDSRWSSGGEICQLFATSENVALLLDLLDGSSELRQLLFRVWQQQDQQPPAQGVAVATPVVLDFLDAVGVLACNVFTFLRPTLSREVERKIENDLQTILLQRPRSGLSIKSGDCIRRFVSFPKHHQAQAQTLVSGTATTKRCCVVQ